jgi:hypothetical protein
MDTFSVRRIVRGTVEEFTAFKLHCTPLVTNIVPFLNLQRANSFGACSEIGLPRASLLLQPKVRFLIIELSEAQLGYRASEPLPASCDCTTLFIVLIIKGWVVPFDPTFRVCWGVI